MLPLEQNTIKKRQMDKNNTVELDVDDNKDIEYKVKAIGNNAVYIKKLMGHLQRLYYLIYWKGYLKEKNT